MKKFVLAMFVLCFTLSTVLAQTNATTEAVTDDAAMARLRVSNCVFGGPNVDIFLNGEVAVNNGIPQSNVPTLETWGYQYLAPGTYSVAVVPTEMSLKEALVGPVDVIVEAGHRYTLVVLGQNDEPNHEALVIDETAAYQELGAKPTDTTQITINNVRGVPGIDFSYGGEVRNENVPYGGYKAAIWPAGTVKGLEIGVSGEPEQIFESTDEEIYNTPGTDFIDCFGGTYPGQMGQDFDTHSSMPTSSLNAVDSLKEVTRVGQVAGGDAPTFDTFLNALETAGLTEALTSGEPYLLYAPTDEAFKALPQDQLDALTADQEAMSDLVRFHMGRGYVPYGNLLDPRTSKRSVTTELPGKKLELSTDGTVNGVKVESLDHVMVSNGTRIIPIKQVLLPTE